MNSNNMKTQTKYRLLLAFVLAILTSFTLASIDVMGSMFDALESKEKPPSLVKIVKQR